MRPDILFHGNCVRFPDKTALICGSRRVSYGALQSSVRRYASGLRRAGFGPGRRAVLYLPNGVELVELMFACFASGTTVIPVTTRLSADELAYICDDSRAGLLICGSDQAQACAEIVAGRPGLSGFTVGAPVGGLQPLTDLVGPDAQPEPLPVQADECLVMYTSGTTGRPKGAVMTHANLVVQPCLVNALDWQITDRDVFLVVAPMAHRTGIGRLLNAMLLGGTLCILPSFDPENVLRVVEDESVTVMGVVPTMCRMLLPALEAAPSRAASLRILVVSGEAFPVPLKSRIMALLPDTRLVSFFGMTETGVVTSLDHADQIGHAETVGRAARGVELRIVDLDSGADLAAGQSGELLVRAGPPGAFSVMKEYLDRPDANAEAFSDGWFRTGDIARLDQAGFVYIVDRKKDMIVSGGFNIYSKEVEKVIAKHPAVADVAVVGTPDAIFGEAVVAFVEPHSSGPQPDAEAIIAFCRDRIAGYKKPKHVYFLENLPRTATGKVVKPDLIATAQRCIEQGALKLGGTP